MKEELKKLPKGWEKVKLADCLQSLESGKRPKGGVQNISQGIPSIGAEHLNDKGGFKFEKIKYVPVEFAKNMKSGVIKFNDIIVVKDGATTGKTSFVGKDFPFSFSVINEHVFICRVNNNINSKWIYYNLWSRSGKNQILKDFRGAAQGGISSNFINIVDILSPPFSIQNKIVEKIEELFSELDNGVEELKKVKAQFKIYRQSVLHAAFTGKLTEEWRKEFKSKEKDNAELVISVNTGIQNSELYLPKGWKEVKLKDIASKITDGEHFRPKTQDSGIPFLSAKDIRDNVVLFSNSLYISEVTAQKALKRCNPQKGDILIVSRGATVGRMCIVNIDKVFCLLGSVILIKVDEKQNSKFLLYILKSPTINKKLISLSGSTAQQAIYLRDLKEIEIPFASLSEQQKIVEEIETRLSVCDKMEETIETALAQSESLRQSILKQAFEGKLI